MMHELWIDGQRVDLGADTTFNLEWVSGLFEDIGSIQMSRSYTITLPMTMRNLRILDDPANPAHESRNTRRYLDAQYLRNGIDLLGPAKAYVVGVKANGIEIALLWRVVDGLLEWKEAGKKLSDLATLPTLTWIGSNGMTPDYATEIPESGAFFAHYDSGLEDYTYPDVNAASHPVVTFKSLFDAIFKESAIPYDTQSAADLENTVLLCDGHRPNRIMDQESGTAIMGYARFRAYSGASISFEGRLDGWDPPIEKSPSTTLLLSTSPLTGKKAKKMYFDLSFIHLLQDGDVTYESLVGNAIQLIGISELPDRVLAEVPFTAISTNEEIARISLDIDLGDLYGVQLKLKHPVIDPAWEDDVVYLYPYSSYCLRVGYAHDEINLEHYDSYPVAVNLPNMSQMDFIKGACALLGIIPVVEGGVLRFISSNAALDKGFSADWTDSIANLDEVRPNYEGLARRNVIRYADNEYIYEQLDGVIVTEDTTLTDEAELYSLPFAASLASQAFHYSIEYKVSDGVQIVETKDISIEPRVFGVQGYQDTGELQLIFPERLRGKGLVETYYSKYQETMRRPVVINAVVRLNELDLVRLDFTRPIYMAQTGQYYAIKRVQADNSNLCKVELIRID